MRTNQMTSINPFFKAMDSGTGQDPFAKKVLGEKGAVEHSIYGMAGNNTETQGTLVAAFNQILRQTSEHQVGDLVKNVMTKANAEGCAEYGIMYLCCMWAQLRDREDGKGERRASYYLLLKLFEYCPRTVLKLLHLYPYFGYWKDLSQLDLLVHGNKKYLTIQQKIVKVFVEQLQKDNQKYEKWLASGSQGKLEISLCAKYVPKEKRSFDKKTKIAKRIAKCLFLDVFRTDFKKAMKSYRSYVSRLNKAIDTVEILECSGRYDEIEPTKVPSRCMHIKKRAFLNLKGNKGEVARFPENVRRVACRENFLKFIELAKQGKVSNKGRMMFIHELVGELTEKPYLTQEEIAIVEGQWKSHIDYFEKMMEENGTSLGRGVVVSDVSGSMSGVPMKVSIALGIFVSSLAHPTFRDKFISFHETPKWISLRYPETYAQFQQTPGFKTSWDASRAGGELSLIEKVKVAVSSSWGGTTDFVAVHELILKCCVDAKISPDDMPKWLLIASDMQFDIANGGGHNKYGFLETVCDDFRYIAKIHKWDTIHDCLENAYSKAGMDEFGKPYEVPQQIYWNLRGDTVGFPVQSDTPNTQMISGFNVSVLKLFLSGEDPESFTPSTPWDTFKNAITNKRYDVVRRICSESTEDVLRTYRFMEDDWVVAEVGDEC